MADNFPGLRWAYNSSEFSDLTIVFDSYTFKLHKVIIFGQSPVLRALCDGKEEIKLESLTDIEYPQAYEAMFRFMYGLEYDDSSFDNLIIFYFEMYRVAHYFEYRRLQVFAFEKFKEYTTESWNAGEFMDVLIKGVYLNDQDLQDVLKKGCHEHFDELYIDNNFQDIVQERNGLAFELAKCFSQSLKKYRCPRCKRLWSLDSTVLPSPSYCPNCGLFREFWDTLYGF